MKSELCSLDSAVLHGWSEEASPVPYSRCFRRLGMLVLVSDRVDYKENGELWRHVSFSRRNEIPDYDDIIEVKKAFIGYNGKAIMVFPPKTEHVNIHNFCLHLFAPDGFDPLPDFTLGTGSL